MSPTDACSACAFTLCVSSVVLHHSCGVQTSSSAVGGLQVRKQQARAPQPWQPPPRPKPDPLPDIDYMI